MNNDATWDEWMGKIRYEPTHENGVGRYYKVPGSGADELGYFAFIKAVYDQRFYEEEVDLVNDDHAIPVRCDSGAPRSMPMPTALHEEDLETGLCKICESVLPIYGTTNSHHASLSNALVLRMPFQGHKGFVTYLELRDREVEETEVYENCNVARTLQELFKLMMEWEWVYLNLDSANLYAKLSYEILQEMEVPERIREWVWNNVPDMHVAMYLQGDPDARRRPDPSTIPDMDPDFESWCWYQIAIKPATWKYGVR